MVFVRFGFLKKVEVLDVAAELYWRGAGGVKGLYGVCGEKVLLNSLLGLLLLRFLEKVYSF